MPEDEEPGQPDFRAREDPAELRQQSQQAEQLNEATANLALLAPQARLREFAERLPALAGELTEVARKPETIHYEHPHYPNIHLKASEFELWDTGEPAQLNAQVWGYAGLRESGVAVVPFELKVTGGKFYAIMHKVDGVPLGDVLGSDPTARNQFDDESAGLLAYVGRRRGSNMAFASDIFGASQRMWGHLFGEQDQPGVKFVDIETTGGGLVDNLRDFGDDSRYVYMVARAAASMLHDEREYGIQMPKMRAAIAAQLEILRTKTSSLDVPGQALTIEQAIASGNDDFMDNF